MIVLRMFVWHRVADFARWKAVADAQREAREAAGLRLEWVRQDDRDPDHIIFSLLVEDRERAEAFVNDPGAAHLGEEAGVLEGGYFYVHDA
jgi:hypothetical protein